MKTLKKVTSAALLAVALLFGTSAFAQQGQGNGQGARLTPAERAQMQVDRFQKQLDLTPDQTTKIKEVVQASAQEMDKLRINGGRPDREAMQALNQKRNDQIKALLTDAQKAKFEQLLADQQNRMRNGQGGGRRNQGDN